MVAGVWENFSIKLYALIKTCLNVALVLLLVYQCTNVRVPDGSLRELESPFVEGCFGLKCAQMAPRGAERDLSLQG